MPENSGQLSGPLEGPYSEDNCFFCGVDNDSGLKLKFYRTQGDSPELVCRFTPDIRFSGLGRILHGGIQCGLFDEIMGWTAHNLTGQPSVTGEMTVQFRRPAYIEEPLEVRCRITGQEGPKVFLAAEITGADGQVKSRSSGFYIMVTPQRFAEITGSEVL